MKKALLPRSLQTRLLVLVLTLATILWLGAAVTIWFDAQHELDELLDGHLTQSAALLVLQAEDGDDDISDVPILHKYVPPVAYQVFVGSRLVLRSPNVGLTPMTALQDGFSSVRQPDGQAWRVFSTYNAKHEVTVHVGEKIESRKAILWAVMRSMLAPLVFGFPLFGVIVWWSVRQGLAPIHELRTLLGERTPHATDPVQLEGTPPELVPLVRALNELLQRISQMVEAERRFTADAAHELRTPLAAIRAQAQVAMGADDDRAERTHALQQTLAGCDRAARLVAQLLTLARLEAEPGFIKNPVDLGAVVQRIATELRASLEKRAQQLNLRLDTAGVVLAEELLLGVLVRNLMDNALRYSPNGATVQVSVWADSAGVVELVVQDSGPGMSPDAIRHLGERFFRVLGTEQTGSGLGWSIVSRVAHLFDAHVEIGRSVELGGLQVRIAWRQSVALASAGT